MANLYRLMREVEDLLEQARSDRKSKPRRAYEYIKRNTLHFGGVFFRIVGYVLSKLMTVVYYIIASAIVLFISIVRKPNGK